LCWACPGLMDMADKAEAAYIPTACYSDENMEKERPCTKEEQEADKGQLGS
jgi:hypothetical protein